jgi:hypothetical protein
METVKTVITGKPLVDLDSIPDMLGDVENDIDRNFAPAGRLIDPEKAAQAVTVSDAGCREHLHRQHERF